MTFRLFRPPLSACLPLALASTLAAAPTPPLTLDDALRVGLQQNPSLRAAQARIDAAAGRATQAAVWANPELTLDGEDVPASRGRLSEGKQLVGVTQTIPFPGKKSLDYQVERAAVTGAEAALELRRRELVRDIKAAYFGLLAADAFTAIARELVDAARSSAEAAAKRVTAGAAPDQEQLRAEVLLEQARAELLTRERERLTAREDLRELVGLDGPVAVVGSLPELWGATLLDARDDEWLPRHPQAVAAGAEQGQAELALRRARVAAYPDVRVSVAGGRAGDTDRSIVQLGVGLPLPLFDRSQGTRREARANVVAAEASRASVERQLRRAHATAVARVRTARDQVDAYRDRVLPKADTALRLVQTGFAEGKFNLIDLLDTQRTAADARLGYAQRLLECHLATADLELLVGPGYPAAQAPAASPVPSSSSFSR